MIKKTLLNESVTRRFMKLANLGHLQESFFEEEMVRGKGEEDFSDVDHTYAEGQMEDEGALEDEAQMEDEGEEEEAAEAPEMPEAPEAAADEVEITEDDRKAIESALAVLSKIVGGGGMPAPEAPMAPPPAPEEAPMAPEEGEEEGMEEGVDEVEVVDEEALIKEVTRRVTERIRSVIKK